jgi:hypothetical protein
VKGVGMGLEGGWKRIGSGTGSGVERGWNGGGGFGRGCLAWLIWSFTIGEKTVDFVNCTTIDRRTEESTDN